MHAPTKYRLEHDITSMRAAMAEASKIILAGFELRTDATRVHYPDRFQDPRGTTMWNRVIELITRRATPTTKTINASVLAADQRRHERRSRAAKKAAETRSERKEKKVYAIAKHYVETGNGGRIGPRGCCYICGKKLDDPDSVTRGIGSDCWQDVLDEISQLTQPQ